MAFFGLSQTSTRPQFQGINRDNPITRDLSWVFAGARPSVDPISGGPWTLASVASPGFIPGVGIATSTGGSTSMASRSGGPSPTRAAFIAIYRATSSSVFGTPATFSSVTNGSMRLEINGSSVYMVKGGVVQLNSASIASTGTILVVASHDSVSGDYFILTRNLLTGVRSSNTQTNTSAPNAGDGVVGVCSRGAALNGEIALSAGWARHLTRAEGEALINNPWQLFVQQSRQLWVPASGGAVSHDSTGSLVNAGASTSGSAARTRVHTASGSFSNPGATTSGVASRPNEYRAGSDVSVNGWIATPGGSLASCIDEPVPSDTDYITSPNLTDPAILTWLNPVPAGTWTIAVRANRTGASGQVRIDMLNGSNVSQGTSAWQALTGSAATYNLTVTTTGTASRFRIEVQA